MPVVYMRYGLLLLFIVAQSVRAAPFFNFDQPFIDVRQGYTAIEIKYRTDKNIQQLSTFISDNSGQIIHRDTRFDFLQGEQRWRWKGRLEDGKALKPGQYQLVFNALFADGTSETEIVNLRVLEKAVAPLQKKGFAPPVVPYRSPSHRVSGSIRLTRQEEAVSGDVVRDRRVRIRFSEREKNYRADATFGYSKRTGGTENTDSSSAKYQLRWKGGKVDTVFRRSLGDFKDPLRLFADFRAVRDKRGIKLTQDIARLGKLQLLALNAQPAAGQRQNSYAVRWAGKLTSDLEYGLSFVDDDRDSGASTNIVSNAGGLDLNWKINDAHRLELAVSATDTQSTDAAVSSGKGSGQRISWLYQKSGLRTKVGYLNLSEKYHAALSDPGNQITADVYGPEATIDYLSSVSGEVISNLALAGRTFRYRRYSSNEIISQIESTAQFRLLNLYQLSANFRTREESGVRSSSFTLSEQHRLNKDWRMNLQYSQNNGSGTRTNRFVSGFSKGSGRNYDRLTAEYLYRNGKNIANGPVNELGLNVSGQRNNFKYQGLFRRTVTADESGLNLYARLSYEPKYLHRYRPEMFIAFGDRSSVDYTRRVEFGVVMKF